MDDERSTHMGKLKSGCSIYLVFSGKKIKIPVNPEEIEIKHPTDHKTYDVIGVGEIVVPRKPSLKEISWESFFPGDRSAVYVNSGAKVPSYYMKSLESALKKKRVGRLIITRSGVYDTNIKCIVSNFEIKDKGGEPKDIYYSLELKEYRSYAPKVVSILATPAPGQTNTEASTETARAVETPVLRVGAPCVVNGEYCYDSYGGKPHGIANNLNTTVTRIVSGNPYPVHVGSYGWVTESQLQITG